jgi:iron complex transport system substrate-binding protein
MGGPTNMRKIIWTIFTVMLLAVCFETQVIAAIRTITDDKGRTVEIPMVLDRVVSISSYITFTSIVLGGGEKLVGIESSCLNNKNLKKIYPDVTGKPDIGYEDTPNYEGILEVNPQVILTTAWDKKLKTLEAKLGLPIICINMDDSRASTKFIGDLLGKQAAAKRYTDYFDEKMEMIDQVVSGEASKPKVYIAAGYGKGGLQTTWTKSSTWGKDVVACGGVYVADFRGGGTRNVSKEQLLNWNPDILILDQSCFESKKSVMKDIRWASLSAVKNNAVHRGPDGFISTFGRPHIEAILSRLWITDKFFPGKMDINMLEVADDFYQKFYGVKLTNKELKDRMMPGN